MHFEMKKLVILGTRHQALEDGPSPEFREALTLIIKQFNVQVIFEEWSTTRSESVCHHLAKEWGLIWRDVGTPDLPEFKTDELDRALFNHQSPTGVMVNGYGPLEAQRAREELMVKNIGSFSNRWNYGLLVVGIAHLHSMMERLSPSYVVEGFSWLPKFQT
jgi:hypothetical protein